MTEKEAPGVSRRGLVAGVGAVAALFAVGGVGRALATEEVLLRPPGGQDMALLLGACIRCDRCRSACPHDGIDVATVESGLVNVRTPAMDFHRGYCDACEGAYRCVEACPTGALVPFDKKTDKIGMAVIDFDRCEAYGVSARCKYDCIDKCPEDALSKNENGGLELDAELCWGCGMCTYFCPSNSYGSFDGSVLRGIEVQQWGWES